MDREIGCVPTSIDAQASGMMECSSCNGTIPDDSKFCNLCGTRVTAPTVDRPPQETPVRHMARALPFATMPQRGRGGPVSLSRSERVQACLDKIIVSNDLPAFSNHLSSLVSLLQSEDASLRRLTNIIISDYSLSLEVMRKANSFYYNRSGSTICSITHAVAMLGADAIYLLASRMRFLDHYARKSQGLAELLLLSSLTSSHTRHLAKTLASNRMEEACLGGLLRNLGEVLIACYFPEEYGKILAKMKQQNWDSKEACLNVMGFSYDELGLSLAKHWKLPSSISEAMDETPDKDINGSPLNALISFCHALTNTVYRSGPDSSPQKVRALFEKYKSVLNIDHNQAAEILEAGIQDTKETFSTLKVQLNQLRIERQIDIALERVQDNAAAAGSAEGVEADPKLLIMQLADELESTVKSNPAVDISQVILMALEAIFRGGSFDRILLCLVTPDHREIRGRLGFGKEIESIANRFRMQLEDRNEPLVRVLSSGQDVFVSLDITPEFKESAIIRHLNPECFGLFPIVVNTTLIGAIYFDRIESGRSVDPETLPIISKLREIASHAIERGRLSQSEVSLSVAQLAAPL